VSDFSTQLRALSAKATPGPWIADLNHDHPFLNPVIRGIAGMFWGVHESTPEAEDAMVAEVEASASLIAFLRNHADALAEAVEALEEVMEGRTLDGHVPIELTVPCERALARLNGGAKKEGML
jgi:hypothetical protein